MWCAGYYVSGLEEDGVIYSLPLRAGVSVPAVLGCQPDFIWNSLNSKNGGALL